MKIRMPLLYPNMAHKYGSLAWLAAVSMTFLAPQARAGGNADDFALSPEELFSATVVSVSKKEEKLVDAPAAIFVLSNEDIIRSGATSIPEALRMVPGVQVARVNANSWAISVRGFNGSLTNKLLVLIDGRTVYDPLFSGVYWDVQDTVLEDIERIEVIRGPGATMWGANAVNGVINIITKKASDTQGNLASVTAGNQDRIVEGRSGGKLGDNGYYRVYGKYFDREDEQTVSGLNARDGQEMGHGGFRADWKDNSTAKDDYTLQGDIFHSGTGNYRTTPIFNTTTRQLNVEDIDAKGANILGRWNRTLDDDAHLTVQSYVDYEERNQLLLGDKRTTFDVDAQYEFPQAGRHQFITGGGYRYSTDLLTAMPLTTFTDNGERTQVFSSFLQDKITLVPKSWFLTLGSKLEHNDYTGFEIEPNARLQWHINDKQMAWTSVSRAVRTPSRLEEDLHFVQVAAPSASIDTLPNPELESEKLVAYEVGYRQQLTPKVTADVAAFYNDYDGLVNYTSQGLSIGSNPTRLVIGLGPENITSAKTYGGETALSWHALPEWNLSASYSLLFMHVHSSVTSAKQAEDQSPQHQANLRSQWDVSKDVTFDTMLYYNSGLDAFGVKDRVRLDMRLGWKLTDGLQFSLVGQDLLDASKHEFGSPTDNQLFATEINRSVYGNFTWRF